MVPSSSATSSSLVKMRMGVRAMGSDLDLMCERAQTCNSRVSTTMSSSLQIAATYVLSALLMIGTDNTDDSSPQGLKKQKLNTLMGVFKVAVSIFISWSACHSKRKSTH